MLSQSITQAQHVCVSWRLSSAAVPLWFLTQVWPTGSMLALWHQCVPWYSAWCPWRLRTGQGVCADECVHVCVCLTYSDEQALETVCT